MKPIFLELRHLKTLLALKETGSVSLAAKRVYLTQSALSHQIKLLEDQYGLPLFERKTQPLHFTPAGERLIQLANDILPKVIEAGETRGSRRVAHCGGMPHLLRLAYARHGFIPSTLAFGGVGYCVRFPYRCRWVVVKPSC